MSQEDFNLLNQEAISRMSPYELVERAVRVQSQEQNTLGIDPIELEDGVILHTVASSLTAGAYLQTQLAIEEGQLIRRQVMHNPATLLASVVELHPPRNDSENGDARLYRIQESLALPLAEAQAPFRTTAVKAVNWDARTKGLSPIRFNDITNTFYQPLPWTEEGADYLSTNSDEGLMILATEETQIHLQEVGKDELDEEIGVLATLSGLARIVLAESHFVRITDNGVFYGPSNEQTVEIDIPLNTPQHQENAYHRIPDDATVGPNKEGKLVPLGDRAKDKKYKYTTLNPTLSPTEALALIGGPEAIDWTEGTDAFLRSLEGNIASLMPLDAQATYKQTRQLAKDKVRGALTDCKPQIGEVGCLAVAAYVSELSRPSGGRHVDATFFSKAI